MRKKLLKIYLPLLYIIGIQSCTMYHVYETNSTNVNYINNDTYIYEDSIFIISYYLWRDGGILHFSLYNKTHKPIYIDWNKSNYIWQGQSNDYWQDKIKSTSLITGGGAFTKVNKTQSGYGFAASTVSILTKDKPSIQLPPNSFIQVGRFNLLGLALNLNEKNSIRKEIIEINYSKDESPLNFRNYIAYSFDKDYDNLFFLDNEFWIEKIYLMDEANFHQLYSTYSKNTKDRCNKFYKSKRDGKRTFLAITGGCLGFSSFVGILYLLSRIGK